MSKRNQAYDEQNDASNNSSLQARKAASEPVASLRGRALRLLARRDWSRDALRAKLLSSTADHDEGSEASAEVDELLDDFTSRGWLSDARYAQELVRSRQNRNGKTAIAQRLKRAGVSEADAAAALSAIAPDQEYQTALTLWRRKFQIGRAHV